ncbi:MAG: DEAD/DEAH box helicase [Planctomycetia bacterium]|nr:DEAD/DEAH box helicase [Planctomycetia bacterium]
MEPAAGFKNLGLSPASLAAVSHVNYQVPSPIQAAFIPKAVTGRDCIGQARTGTGKTAAFALPILERIDAASTHVQAIVLTPTRELSEQVAVECRRLAYTRPVHVVCCVGGKQIRRQIDALKQGAQIVVGTPGRVLDLMSRKLLILDQIRIAVLDEADRMLDIGFRPDIEKILRRCPTERQTLLLSATLPAPVERLAQRYMRSPERVDLSKDQVAVETVEQFYVTVDHDRKLRTLVQLLVQERPRQALVFCRTKRGTDNLYRKLSAKLPGVSVIHGDLQQPVRDRAMREFRDGTTRLLIATDVVGRGIDVSGISHIINYDIPEFCDDYVHRIGRTGRLSGERGFAFTFVCRDEGEQLTNIEMRINKMLPQYQFTNFQSTLQPARKPVAAAPPPPAPTLVEAEEEFAEFALGVA